MRYMKKLLAGASAAAMLFSTSFTAFAAQETEAPEAPMTVYGTEVTVKVDVDGDTVTEQTRLLIDSEGDLNYSTFSQIPSEEGEDLTFDFTDLYRIVGSDLYLNTDAVSRLASLVTQQDVTQIVQSLGIDSEWICIPAPNFVIHTEKVEELLSPSFPEIDFSQDAIKFLSLFDITETDESYIFTFDKGLLIQIADFADDFLASHGDELVEAIPMPDLTLLTEIFDYKASFHEYFEAYARGRAAATGETTEDILDGTYAMIDSLLDSFLSSDVTGLPSKDYLKQILLQVPDLSELVADELSDIDFSGQVTVAKAMDKIDGNLSVTIREQPSATASDGTDAQTVEERTISIAFNGELLENGVTGSYTVDAGEGEALTGTFTSIATEDGLTLNETLSSGETELMNLILNVHGGEDSLDADLTVVQAGSDPFTAELHVKPDETGVTARLTASVGETQVLSAELVAQQTENGYSISLTASNEEQELFAANCEFSALENGFDAKGSLTQNGAEICSASASLTGDDSGFQFHGVLNSQGEEVGTVDLALKADDNNLTINGVLSRQGQEIEKLDITAEAGETGFTCVAVLSQQGQEVTKLDISAETGEEGFKGKAVLSQQGQEVGRLTVSLKTDENGFSFNAVAAAPEQEVANLSLDVQSQDNDVLVNGTLTVNGEQLGYLEFKHDTENTGATGCLLLEVQGEQLFQLDYSLHYEGTEAKAYAVLTTQGQERIRVEGTLKGLEDGTMQFDGILALNGEKIATCGAAILATGSGFSGTWYVTIDTLKIDGTIALDQEAGTFDLTASAADAEKALASVSLNVKVGEAEGITDITAPDNYTTLYDVIEKVSYLFYSGMQQGTAAAE